MTTVVPTSEEDPALSIVRFTAEMSWADAGQEVAEPQVNRLCIETQECVIEGRWLDLASLMLTSADLIFSKASEKDLECIFTIICNLVKKPESLDQNRFVYMKALNLAINGKVTEHILPSFKKIDSFLQEWNLGVKDQRELFLKISNILKETKGYAKESFKFLMKYLETFSGEDSYSMNEAKEEALRTIIAFVKAPDMFQCGLLDMPGCSPIEKDAKYALAYQLLKIFLTGRLDDYLNFQEANSELLKTYGLIHEDCVEKMRLLTLVDLGMMGTGQIPYSMIKDTLKIG
ncbi:hypothetical protein HAX54_009080 [Datura stramonium]|uniref:Uncharacterized protein n=1 Tax=Datura stramonium TaxID=4076 RepID=A0ABS8RVZ3_DATST|nr:hypothetical protein [Datura stramonium]